MSKFRRNLLSAAMAALLCATSASAQLLPGVSLPQVQLPSLPVGNVPVAGEVVEQVLGTREAEQAIRPSLNRVAGLPPRIAEAGAATLLELRRQRHQLLIRQNRKLLEADDRGQPVRRGVVLVVDPDPISLQLADRAGFRLVGDDRNADLGIRVVQLSVPGGMNARSGLRLLQRIAPRLSADFDHLFEPAGGSLAPLHAALAASGVTARGGVLGMIDGGVASHPSLAAASIEQNGFAGSPQPTGHGTAVASLLVGRQGPFSGAAAGAQLYVADVYGGSSAAGSAATVVKALAWLAGKRAQVINISLVGPPNKVVAHAIQRVQGRGIQLVAAVGNDGPAAPPQYPASYAGVIAVTGVDGRGRALPEAGKPLHLDFAAPGADLAAALPGKGYARVRGTSFAAPLAAARLLATGSPVRLASEARPGRGRIGRGIVCGDCGIPPRRVGAK